MAGGIPWDQLKADTLRLVCRDLGATPGKRKRDDMIGFLNKVEKRGREFSTYLFISHTYHLLS